jgi:hypothetical protein
LNAGQPIVLNHPSRAAAVAAVRDSPFAVTHFTGEGINGQLFLHARGSFGRTDGQMEENICTIEFLGRSSEKKAAKKLAKQVREIYWQLQLDWTLEGQLDLFRPGMSPQQTPKTAK